MRHVIKTQWLLRAAGVGALLPFVVAATTVLLFAVVPCAELGCVSLLDSAGDTALWIAAFLGWPLLHLLRVRPALPVAALGTLFMVVIWQFVDFEFDTAAGIVAYPVAVLLTRAHRTG